MQGLVHKSGGRIGRPLALALALLSLLFLLQVTPHTHTNGQDEAACGLCQAAHVGATPAVSGIVLSVPLVAVGMISAPIVLAANENFFSHSDPARSSRGSSALNPAYSDSLAPAIPWPRDRLFEGGPTNAQLIAP